MSYRLRFLPPDEYYRLEKVPTWEQTPDPAHSLILIAEQDGEIIGTWGAVEHVTMEGLWAAPNHRGTALPVRMFEFMIKELEARGIPGVTATITNPEVLDQAHRLGFIDFPGTTTGLRF